MNPGRVGPVSFPGDYVETSLTDQSFSDFCAGLVKFMGAMGGFTEEDVAATADRFEERVIIRPVAPEFLGKVTQSRRILTLVQRCHSNYP
jgi:hypothetical protein